MPISSILKLYNKIFRRDKYYQLKYQKLLEERINYYNSEIYKKIVEIEKNIKDRKELSFLHSGHLGDIINSLPSIKEIAKNKKCKLFIKIQGDYLSESSVKKLIPFFFLYPLLTIKAKSFFL